MRLFPFFASALTALSLGLPAVAEFDPNRTREVLVKNRCSHTDVDLLIKYSPSPDDWRKLGWWRLNAGEEVYLTDNGRRLKHRDNATFYYYIEDLDSDYVLHGDYGINYEGEHYEGNEAARVILGNTVVIGVAWRGC